MGGAVLFSIIMYLETRDDRPQLSVVTCLSPSFTGGQWLSPLKSRKWKRLVLKLKLRLEEVAVERKRRVKLTPTIVTTLIHVNDGDMFVIPSPLQHPLAVWDIHGRKS